MKVTSISTSQTIFCLMGPTAAGKTNLAIELVKRFPFEIISVDSAMVYRGMNIGTAKPTAAECQIAPHRLINICDPSVPYSAGQFRQDALRAIENIFADDRIPLLVGGTMLYFHVLQHGLSLLPNANPAIRTKIAAIAAEHGWEFLHKKLQQLDPMTAEKIHPHDAQRIARALEIYETTGKSLSAIIREEDLSSLPYRFINVAVAPADRIVLHERIHNRLQHMLQRGFLNEVEQLLQRGDLHADLPAIRTVGYRQFWNYLSGKGSYEEACERIVFATRQLAKRQLTWLRSWKDLQWFDSEDNKLFEKLIHHFNL